jgi:thioredoxin 1
LRLLTKQNMNQVSRLTDRNFEEEINQSGVPILVEFWASWCPPCKMVDPVLDELAEEYIGKVKIGKLNVDQNPITGSKYVVNGVPTFILFNSGEPVGRKVGAQSKNQLRKIIDP